MLEEHACMPAMIDCSLTRTAVVGHASRRGLLRGSDGTGRRRGVGDGADRVSGDDADAGATASSSVSQAAARRSPRRAGARTFSTWPTPVASRAAPRAIRTASNDGARVSQFQADGRAPSQISTSRLSWTSRMPSMPRDGRRALAEPRRSRRQPGRAGRPVRGCGRAGRGREPGCRDGDVERAAAGGPGEGLARLPALAHDHGPRAVGASWLATTSAPRPLKLRTGCRRLQLDPHGRHPSAGLKRPRAVRADVRGTPGRSPGEPGPIQRVSRRVRGHGTW